MSLHKAHIELSYGIADVTTPFTNELSDSKFLVLKLNTNFLNNSLKVERFEVINIQMDYYICTILVTFRGHC